MIELMATPLDLKAAAQSAAMSDHLIRVGNLKQIQKANNWTDSELARHCRRKPQQVHAWFENDRRIGERLARSLEEALNLSRYALDDRGGLPSLGEASLGQGMPAQPLSHAKTRLREVPILNWVDVGSMLETDNATLKAKSPHLETFAHGSNQIKFIAMPDESMVPEIQAGDHLLFDPTEAPRAGDVVLIRLPSHEHFVRTFRPRTAYIFEALAANQHFQPLTSKEDGAQVVAVMVEHRRYRR